MRACSGGSVLQGSLCSRDKVVIEVRGLQGIAVAASPMLGTAWQCWALNGLGSR